jgi:hypothetical protein
LLLPLAFASKVYVVGRRKQKLEEAARLSSNIVPIVGDVTSKASLMKVAEQAKQQTGKVFKYTAQNLRRGMAIAFPVLFVVLCLSVNANQPQYM